MAEKEYIERETAMHIVKSTCGDYATAFSMIRKLPAADVVEVVRCKDCIHYSSNKPKSQLHRSGYCLLNEEVTDDKREPNDFCSYGERKELDNEQN